MQTLQLRSEYQHSALASRPAGLALPAELDGVVTIDPKFLFACDAGIPVVIANPDSPQAKAFRKVAEEVARQVSIEAMKPDLVIMSRVK